MSRLVLHRAFGSPPARAVLMLSELIGLQPEIKEVNLLHMEHKTPEFKKNELEAAIDDPTEQFAEREEFEKQYYILVASARQLITGARKSFSGDASTGLNPMGTVPVIQDGDFVLSESHAIMKYLLEKYGGDKREALYPSEVRMRALVDQAMFFDAGVFFAALMAVGAQTLFGNIERPTAAHIGRIESSYSVLEAYLQDRKYVAADHLTLADLSTGATATAIQVMLKLDSSKYPRCADWLARLQDEHVFKTINAPGAAFFAKMTAKLWEKNRLKNNKEKLI